MDLFNLEGKKAIITGGSRGLGKGMAKGLSKLGVEIVIMGTTRNVLSTAEELDSPEARVCGVISDFRDKTSVANSFHQAIEILGDIDILVNNAGTQIRHPSEDYPLGDWETVLAVNLTSAFIMSQLAGKIMLNKGCGKIINIASLLSFSGGYLVPAYAAGKGGIAQLTKALSNEWAVRGINVNAIAPGYMETENTADLREDPIRSRQILERIPAGRWGTAEDVIGALVYLSSKASDYVNGTIIVVDGGWMGR